MEIRIKQCSHRKIENLNEESERNVRYNTKNESYVLREYNKDGQQQAGKADF